MLRARGFDDYVVELCSGADALRPVLAAELAYKVKGIVRGDADFGLVLGVAVETERSGPTGPTVLLYFHSVGGAGGAGGVLSGR